MKALVVEPMREWSLSLREVPEPDPEEGPILVEARALGICGTDREIVAGSYGAAPEGDEYLVLGHESLGVVLDAPANAGVRPGDRIVPFVRRPDPVPCDCCAAGAWDRCRNGLFSEHGIKELHGFGRERYRVPAGRFITVDSALGLDAVLVEPTSVVAKAWMEIERVRSGVCPVPSRVLITGAGPIGLLAALLGTQRGLDVHLFDRVSDGPKPDLARALGATYHTGELGDLPDDFDLVIECTGVPALAGQVIARTAPDGIVCLLGVNGGDNAGPPAAALNDLLVLGNRTMFGSVNANRSHYEAAHEALVRAPADWRSALLTRRIPLGAWSTAFSRAAGDVKTVIIMEADD